MTAYPEDGSGEGTERSGDTDDGLEALPETFEQALGELEALVARMEQGELTLEASVAAFERGVRLHRFCQAALARAERKISILSGPGSEDEALRPADPEQILTEGVRAPEEGAS